MQAFVVKGVSVKVLREKIPKGVNALITGLISVNPSENKNSPPVIIQSPNVLVIGSDVKWIDEAGIVGHSVNKFEYKESFFPREGQEWSIHVSNFPNTWTLEKVRKFLRSYLCRIFGFNWRMYFPVDRETGLVKGHGTICLNEEYEKTLSDEEKKNIISLMKLSLHNKNVENNFYLNARWSQKSKIHSKVEKTKEIHTDAVKNDVVEDSTVCVSTN